MKAAPLCFCVLALSALLKAAPAPSAPSAAELVDEAIWWPGDFSQVCGGVTGIGPFREPLMRGYDAIVAQGYFLSKDTTARLKAHKAEVSAELLARLKAFDWKHVPAAPPVSKRVKAIKTAAWKAGGGDEAGPGPWEPPNARALNGAMLRIIREVGAVETLPELLRLEDELDKINAKALEAAWSLMSDTKHLPKLDLPPIQVGGTVLWEEYTDDWREAGSPENPTAVLKWKQRVFDSVVFQREILGVCLALVDEAKYEPLKTSLVGRLRELGLRHIGLRMMDNLKIHGKADMKGQADDLYWDDARGFPLSQFDRAEIPWTPAIREDARAIAEAFLKGDKPTGDRDGKALLETAIDRPGNFSQMCGVPPPIPFEAPLPIVASLVPHYFRLSKDQQINLIAYRASVIPPLVAALHSIEPDKTTAPPEPKSDAAEVPTGSSPPRKSGQSPNQLGPLVLKTASLLNAVEALPEILRIEASLNDIGIHAAKDESFTPPPFSLDSPMGWVGQKGYSENDKAAAAAFERKSRLFACHVYQRELLGTIYEMLKAEEFAPLTKSKVQAAFEAEGHKQLTKELKGIKTQVQFSRWQRSTALPEARTVVWDDDKNRPIVMENVAYIANIEYTPAARDELRGLAEDYLKTVPPEKRKAGDAMKLFWTIHIDEQ